MRIHTTTLIAMIAAASLLPSAAIAQKPKSNTKKATGSAIEASTDKTQYEALDVFDTKALEEWLQKYPKSKYTAQVKLALELQSIIGKVKAGESKPQLVIPFSGSAEFWKESQELLPERGMLGIGKAMKTPSGKDLKQLTDGKEPAFFAFSPIPDRMFRVRHLNGAQISTHDEVLILTGLPAYPTGNGSIIAWLSKDKAWPMMSHYSIRTGDSPVYFGIIEDLGLVHLKGKGTVTNKDDNSVEIKLE